MFFRENLGRVAARAIAGTAIVASLASCGGGTYQENKFVPARLLTFGDESSRLEGTDGLKYSINGISSSTDVVDCSVNPLWNQILANAYDISYTNCNTQQVASPNGFDYTTVDATVDDVATQVQNFQATDQFNSNDLVTIWVGMHDVLNEYEANGSSNDATTLSADMKAEGANLAAIVNGIAAAGAKVILLTIPDMGQSPYAYTQNQLGDFDRAALLSTMSAAFNVGLRVNITNDGSKIGLVLPDNIVSSMVNNSSSYGLISSPNQEAGCDPSVELPNCDDSTLITDEGKNSNATSIYLWADATHLAPSAHTQIGNSAESRARSNPF